jgi:hypothetical protein
MNRFIHQCLKVGSDKVESKKPNAGMSAPR